MKANAESNYYLSQVATHWKQLGLFTKSTHLIVLISSVLLGFAAFSYGSGG